MTQKAVTYSRVSSRAQAETGTGLESQQKRCCDHAAAQSYSVEMCFQDTMTGGVDYMKRPGMVALLSFLDAQPDENFVVIIDDPKRLARSTRFHIELREALRNRGARLECLNFKFEETPEGEFIETIIAAQGQLERKQNGRQVGQKMRARMESGYWVHRCPVGMIYKPVPGRGKMLFHDSEWGPVIREAIEGYASGRFQTQAEVKTFLESFPTFPHLKRGRPTQQRVTDILTSPIYAGYICSENYGIHWLKGQHEPLISLETYDKVQERRSGKAKAPKRKNIGNHFALRGIATCACCDVPLRSSFTRGNGGTYAYYLCQTKGCEAYGKSIKRDQIEDDVGALIKSLQPDPSVIEMLTAMFRQIWEAKRAQATEIVRAGKRQIAAMDKEIDKLLELIMASTNTTVVRKYEEKIEQHTYDKALLEEKLAKQVEPSGTFEEKLEPAIAFLTNPWKLWQTPGKSQIHLRRLVLKLAFQNRIKYCRKTGARTPKLSFPFKALRGIAGGEVCYGAPTRTHKRPVTIYNKIFLLLRLILMPPEMPPNLTGHLPLRNAQSNETRRNGVIG